MQPPDLYRSEMVFTGIKKDQLGKDGKIQAHGKVIGADIQPLKLRALGYPKFIDVVIIGHYLLQLGIIINFEPRKAVVAQVEVLQFFKSGKIDARQVILGKAEQLKIDATFKVDRFNIAIEQV